MSAAAKKRAAGVLLHLTSSPSPFGIGVAGDEAVRFAEKLASMGFAYWQILPVTPIGAGDSPYDSASAFGGETLLIDPRFVMRLGLCTPGDVDACRYPGSPYTADYAFAREAKDKLLRKAWSNADSAVRAETEKFAAENPDAALYALFLAIGDKNGGKRWDEWGKLSDRGYAEKAFAADPGAYPERGYHLFCQWLFAECFADFKKRVNAAGIRLLGDMPFYVSYSSCDCWAHTECFDIDPVTYSPGLAAGVPPDYFSADGQLWGNPVYCWQRMRADGYAWWRRRIKTALSMFDTLRLDHFRAFASFWAVDRAEKTAKNGSWLPADGEKLFSLVREDTPGCDIIAEDLGVFGDDVISLLESTGFAGMKIIQFGFDPSCDSTHLPHNCVNNSVSFVGTHDNNTLLGWLWEASPDERAFALDYCGFDGSDWSAGGYRAPACRRIIETVWRSPSYLAIIPFQDMCGFGSDARMNVPGVPSGNWRFRTTEETVAGIDADWFTRLNKTFRR